MSRSTLSLSLVGNVSGTSTWRLTGSHRRSECILVPSTAGRRETSHSETKGASAWMRSRI